MPLHVIETYKNGRAPVAAYDEDVSLTLFAGHIGCGVSFAGQGACGVPRS